MTKSNIYMKNVIRKHFGTKFCSRYKKGSTVSQGKVECENTYITSVYPVTIEIMIILTVMDLSLLIKISSIYSFLPEDSLT